MSKRVKVIFWVGFIFLLVYVIIRPGTWNEPVRRPLKLILENKCNPDLNPVRTDQGLISSWSFPDLNSELNSAEFFTCIKREFASEWVCEYWTAENCRFYISVLPNGPVFAHCDLPMPGTKTRYLGGQGSGIDSPSEDRIEKRLGEIIRGRFQKYESRKLATTQPTI